MLLYREIDPHVALRPFVQCFWLWRTSPSYRWRKRERILPDGCTELLFDLGDPNCQTAPGSRVLSESNSKVAGQLTSAFEFQSVGTMNMLGVRFHAHGIFPFLKQPLAELTDSVVALKEIWPSLSNELSPHLLAASGDRQRIESVERVLLRLLHKQELQPEPHLQNAVKCISANAGLISIEQLAREIGLGKRQLERIFSLQVGVSPKHYARITRLQRILRLLQRADKYDWPNIVVNCRFYDQSHLTRDFKELTGLTPTEFFGSDQTMARLLLSGQRKTHFYNTC